MPTRSPAVWAAYGGVIGCLCASSVQAYEISVSRPKEQEEWWSPNTLLQSTAQRLRAVVAGSPIMRSEMNKLHKPESASVLLGLDARGQVSRADPVDCEWELWSDWTVCQFTCGNGVSLRTRDIKRSAENGGSCDSNWKEQRSCTNGECPVDCAWKDWNDWGSCSQTCGRGSSTATRDSTPAEFGGEPCVGASQRQMDCNVDPCPVDCAWSDWSDWSFSSSCGAGTKHRHRQVLVPANELGTACVGPTTQSANSAHTECPVDCELDDWGRWSLCSTTCGAGGGPAI